MPNEMNEKTTNDLIAVAERFAAKILTQREAARLQLDRACLLMLNEKDYVCAITLACAADGILGEHLQKNGGRAVTDMIKQVVQHWLNPAIPAKDLNDKYINMARNFLKHRKEVLDEPVEIRLEMEAMNAITRAVANYAQLSEHVTEPMANYFRWMCKEHGDFMNGIIEGEYLKQLDVICKSSDLT